MLKEKSLQRKIDRLTSRVESLEKDNEKLRTENARLKANEELTQKSIADFNSILKQLQEKKTEYESAIREIALMRKGYSDELKKLVSQTRKGVK